jgi:Na+-transporting NADH:ubiquinone oxidoreductase subunit NqrC
MKKKMLLVVSLMCGVSVITAVSLAAAQEQDRERMQTQDRSREMVQTRDQDHIYGSQLMTEKERMEYRERLRAAHTVEEREQIRMEHHKQMQKRAREQGMMLPDEPPERGMGKGGGMGGGMGRGGGRGR